METVIQVPWLINLFDEMELNVLNSTYTLESKVIWRTQCEAVTLRVNMYDVRASLNFGFGVERSQDSA